RARLHRLRPRPGGPMSEPPPGPHRPRVAYEDRDFLDSDEARPLRILAEYLGPLRSFRQQQVRDTVVFFGSARLTSDGPLGRYYDEARELARLVTVWSNTLPHPGCHHLVC